MNAATIATIGMPKMLSTWIKLGLGASVIVAGWWGLASVDYEQYLSPAALTQWLTDAGPLAPLLLIGSMVGAVICFFIARSFGRGALSRFMKTENPFCQMCTDYQLMGAMFVARFIPIFSFDVVSYGAGLTNISLKIFALATLFGMAPPTFAFTYLGSSVISAQWPLIAAGVVMVAFFLAPPKLLTKYRTSALARIFLGPVPTSVPTRRGIPVHACCGGCGAAGRVLTKERQGCARVTAARVATFSCPVLDSVAVNPSPFTIAG